MVSVVLDFVPPADAAGATDPVMNPAGLNESSIMRTQSVEIDAKADDTLRWDSLFDVLDSRFDASIAAAISGTCGEDQNIKTSIIAEETPSLINSSAEIAPADDGATTKTIISAGMTTTDLTTGAAGADGGSVTAGADGGGTGASSIAASPLMTAACSANPASI